MKQCGDACYLKQVRNILYKPKEFPDPCCCQPENPFDCESVQMCQRRTRSVKQWSIMAQNYILMRFLASFHVIFKRYFNNLAKLFNPRYYLFRIMEWSCEIDQQPSRRNTPRAVNGSLDGEIGAIPQGPYRKILFPISFH